LSMDIGIDATDIEIGNVDAGAVIQAVENMNSNMELWCTVRPTVEIIQAFVAKKKLSMGCEWIVIDYVDLMQPTNSKRNETEEDKELWNDIKTKIAMELDVLVIAIESVNKLAADGIMTDDKVVGSYGKIHAVDVAFGYSPYHAVPYKGCPELDDAERERKCRVLNVMADRHRECTGIIMGLEMQKGLINDLLKKSDEEEEDLPWHHR